MRKWWDRVWVLLDRMSKTHFLVSVIVPLALSVFTMLASWLQEVPYFLFIPIGIVVYFLALIATYVTPRVWASFSLPQTQEALTAPQQIEIPGQLSFEFSPGTHVSSDGDKSIIKLTVRNTSPRRVRANGIHVKMESLIPLEKKTVKDHAEITGHTLARDRQPNPTKQPFSLDKDEPETILIAWTFRKSDWILFSGYGPDGKLREDGWNFSKRRYQITIRAYAENADPVVFVGKIGLTKNGDLLLTREDA